MERSMMLHAEPVNPRLNWIVFEDVKGKYLIGHFSGLCMHPGKCHFPFWWTLQRQSILARSLRGWIGEA